MRTKFCIISSFLYPIILLYIYSVLIGLASFISFSNSQYLLQKIIFITIFMLTIISIYFMIRIVFDYKLFELLCTNKIKSLKELDNGLKYLKFIDKSTKERTLKDRINGVFKIIKKYVFIIILQTVLYILISILF